MALIETAKPIDLAISRQKKLPPLWPLAATAALLALANVVAAPLVWEPPLGLWLVGQCAVLAAAWFGAKRLRDRAAGLSTGRTFARWEEPAGTAIAVPMLYAATLLTLMAHYRGIRWWPVVLALLSVAAVSHAIAYRRPSAQPRFVVTDQTPPEPLEDHKLVTLPWDLAPGMPEVAGKIAIWVRRAVVAAFRPPTNPITKWEDGPDGSNRPVFEWYLDNGKCDEIDNLAEQISALSAAHGLAPYSEVCLTLDLVQTIYYRHDDDPEMPEETRFRDYWRFPLETVFDEAGDCDDHAILAASLLSCLGHRTCFFDLRESQHAAIGVAGLPVETGFAVTAPDGDRFYFVETTEDGFEIGELPENIPPSDVRISAIVEPLRARRPADPMPPAAPGLWARDSRWAFGVHVLLGLAAAAAGFALANWS